MRWLDPMYWFAWLRAVALWVRIREWKSIDRGLPINWSPTKDLYMKHQKFITPFTDGTAITPSSEQVNQSKYI